MRKFICWSAGFIILAYIAFLHRSLSNAEQKTAELEEVVDVLNHSEPIVVIINESLKSKQERTKLKISDTIALMRYPRVLSDSELNEVARLIVKYSDRYGVPIDLIISVMTRESAFNPRANSHADARGLLQVMPETGSYLAKELRMTSHDLYNIHDNIRIGTYYLHKMMKQFNSIDMAIRAYNTGPERVKSVISGKSLDYPDETKQYHMIVKDTFNSLQYWVYNDCTFD